MMPADELASQQTAFAATVPRPPERIVADGEWGVVEFSSTGGLGKNGTDYNPGENPRHRMGGYRIPRQGWC